MKSKLKLSALNGLLLIVGLVISLNIQAQETKHHGPPPIPNDQEIEKMVNELANTLSLSEDQKEKISEKYFAHFNEVKAKVEEARPKKEEMENLKSDFEENVKALLDKEQQKKFDEFIQKKQKPRRK